MMSLSGVEGYLNHFFICSLLQPELKERLGIRYLGHMWEETPYWHIWPKAKSGVYKLELQSVSAAEHFEWIAECKVKYYPHRGEEVFSKLSVAERQCRESDMFHNHPSHSGGCPLHNHVHHSLDKFADLGCESGVPRCDLQASMPQDFFYIGHIWIAFSSETGSVLRSETQSTWRVIAERDVVFDCGEDILLPKGSIDRDFPGNELLNTLIASLADAWQQFHGYRFCACQAFEEPGVEFLFNGEALCQRHAADVKRVTCERRMTFIDDIPLALG